MGSCRPYSPPDHCPGHTDPRWLLRQRPQPHCRAYGLAVKNRTNSILNCVRVHVRGVKNLWDDKTGAIYITGLIILIIYQESYYQ